MKRRWLALALAGCLHLSVVAAQPLRSFEPDSFDTIVAQHRGQALVIVLWSLDCEYCLASFQALEEARRQWHLNVVTVATDSALDADTAKEIHEKLRSSGLRAQTWAFGSAAPERLRHAIDPKWRGEMPRTYWFDRQGKMSAYSGLVTPEVVRRFMSR